VTSTGVELGVLWKPTPWLNWYNSASYSDTTYDDDLNWCTGATCVIKATAGKQQVDTPKEMLSSVITADWRGFSASLMGKYTGERFYTYTNDQGFDGYTTFDLGVSYDLGEIGAPGAKFAVNVTNLTDKRYASNFDGSVFAPDDAAGNIVVFHASAPRQIFATLSYDF
jgi:iron complex outermembrane receptor protein